MLTCHALCHLQMCDDAVTRVSSDMAIATFVTEACHLVTAVATCMQTVVPHNPDAFPPEILTEWTELFSASIYSVLLPMFNKLSGKLLFSSTYFHAVFPVVMLCFLLGSTVLSGNKFNLQCSKLELFSVYFIISQILLNLLVHLLHTSSYISMR